MTDRKPKQSVNSFKKLSDHRQEQLAGGIESGLYKGKTGESSLTAASNVAIHGIKKEGQSAQLSSAWTGSADGNSIRQAPSVYSPLYLNSNLNLPRDRASINSWCRAFYALSPIVQNAINLHSTYPISKLNIKCPNRQIEKFFNEMIEEIDLMNICVQVAQEFWLLGESFIYAELDEHAAKWSRLIIQNPDYIVVKKSVIASEPLIMLRPDENLRRIVQSNKPSDVQQRSQLNPGIIEHVKRGENIPLDNFFVSHLSRKISPYEARGTGLPVSCFREMMLFQKIRECYDEETEVLTDQGFKKFNEVIDFQETNELGELTSRPKEGFKIACFNPENELLEYHTPIDSIVKNYEGEMIHFKNEKINLKITPGHELYVSQRKYIYNGKREFRKDYWDKFEKIQAKNLDLNKHNKFRSKADFDFSNCDKKEFIEINGKNIPIETYLEFLGYILSEGCLQKDGKNGCRNTISISQTYKKYQKEINKCMMKFSTAYEKNYSHNISIGEGNHSDVWAGIFCDKALYEHFKSEVSDSNGRTKAPFKKIPRWIFNLDKRLLQILLDAMVKGDGSIYPRKKNKDITAWAYYTTSKQLADDVFELVYKCGHVPTAFSKKDKRENRLDIHTILWSNSEIGNYPLVMKTSKNSQTGEKKSLIDNSKYNGKVWCLTVPTGLFVTRRNGKITIQGNCKMAQADNMINPLTLIKIGSDNYKPTAEDIERWRDIFTQAQYDLDFKIFTHEAVTVEKIGSGAGIYDTSGDITQLLKEIYIGLMVPQVLMEAGDITYANGGVALDVLRQRYMQFRNMMSSWLKRKIFAPISKLNDFYEYKDGEKTLIVPDIDWNHMSLFDAADYINVLVQLSTGEGKKVSQQTLYRSLGLEYEEERRKIRKEDISDAIRSKEMQSLSRMSLNELRSMSEEDEIPEVIDTPIPGESPYAEDGSAQPPKEDGGLGGLPGLDLGGGSSGAGPNLTPPGPPSPPTSPSVPPKA